jgi:hypothetical protein
MTSTIADENWDYLLSLLPADWESAARTTGAVTRLRGCTSISALLRVILLHAGHGCSLRTASVIGKSAGWLQMSDVALHKKLLQSEAWLQHLCLGVLADSRLRLPGPVPTLRMRLIDATTVKEPGRTGSQYHLHYSISLPDWHCDSFLLTAAKGQGNGESLRHFPAAKDDCLLADRGYSKPPSLAHAHQQGACFIVRFNSQSTPLKDDSANPINVLSWLETLRQPGEIGSLPVWIHSSGSAKRRIDPVPARLCAVRKSPEATALAKRKLELKAQRGKSALRPESVALSQWVVVLTNVPPTTLDTTQVLEWYRVRWQVELAFKRLKSLADVGHLPKRDARSSRTWLYAKLLVALLAEKMQRHAAALSPWGGRWLEQDPPEEPLA